MLFTAPIPYTPEQALAAGDAQESNVSNTFTSFLDGVSNNSRTYRFFPSEYHTWQSDVDLVPGSQFGTLIMGMYDRATSRTQVEPNFGANANSREAALITGGRSHVSELGFVPRYLVSNNSRFFALLLPRSVGTPSDFNIVSNPRGRNLQWVVATRVYAAAVPTIMVSPMFGHSRQSVRTITGKTFTTTLSPQPIFGFRYRPSGDPRTDMLDDIGALDSLNRFGCFPCGLETLFVDGSVEWRRPEFYRTMVVKKFTGWGGPRGLDFGGLTGSIEFAESV